MLAGGLLSVQPREHFKEEFIHMFTFPDISYAGILITVFTQLFLKPYL
jgi:hypothetical protein